MNADLYPLPLQGGSMRPLLRSGDVAWIRRGRAGIRPGDLILYRVGRAKRLHRLAFSKGRSAWLFDDAGVVGWHRIESRAILGKIEHPSPLSRGWVGLIYAAISCISFTLGRSLKQVT